MATGMIDNANLKTSLLGGALVAEFKCNKIGDFESGPLRTDIESVAALAQWKIAADFSKVMLLGSQGIGMLVSLKKSCDANKGKLVICGLSEEILMSLKVVALTKMFNIRKDLKEAMGSF
jgi:anti-anti-sigma factor